MSDAVAAFQEAMSEFLAAEKSSNDRMKLISDVSSKLYSDLNSFMGLQYKEGPGVPNGRQSYDQRAKFDMSGWPTADDLKSLLLTWYRTHEKLLQAWRVAEQAGNTAGLMPPPKTMNRRGA